MAKSAIVVGAGIVGLATARALALRGYAVTVVERSDKAVGASIRNFGMVWPIGQPTGLLYERALRSRAIWKEVCTEGKIWYEEAGSLHVAHNKAEQQVLEEFVEASGERPISLLTKQETLKQSEAVVEKGLLLSLHSADELIVDPREAIATIPAYLTEEFGVRFIWSSGVTEIVYPRVWCGKKSFAADAIFVCNGTDFETLFPERFAELPLTKCKLQMMRTAPQPDGWRIGPALCGGLSLIHYKNFAVTPSLNKLTALYEKEMPDYLEWGIHVMVAQQGNGQLTIGDSHEYGQSFEPFNRASINNLILSYLRRFAAFKNETIAETWNGVYPKLTNGRTEIVLHPQEGVTIINGLGGAGMTLSFGLCEEVVATL